MKILRNHPKEESTSACVEEEEVPLLPLGEPPCGRNMLYEFLGQTSSRSDPLFSVHCSQREEDAAHDSHSEEEYEEDIIEPRTLNEIMTVTDKTSPWSSLVSESEQDHHQQAITIRNAEHIKSMGSAKSSPLSSETQDGHRSLPSPVRSGNSPFGEEESEECVRKQVLDFESEELLQPASDSAANQKDGRPSETQKANHEGAAGMLDKGASGEPYPLSDHGDFAVAKAAAAEVEEQAEGLHGEPPSEEGNTNEESPQSCSRLSDTVQCTESCAATNLENPPEDPDQPPKASVILYPFSSSPLSRRSNKHVPHSVTLHRIIRLEGT